MAYPFMFNPWTWRDPTVWTGGDPGGRPDRPEQTGAHADVVGYDVEATDGRIGTIDEASMEVEESYLIVDTGPWIFGRKVLLPAGTIDRVDHEARKVHVDRTKDQIKDSPEYDETTFRTPDYRSRVGSYYQDSYRTWPPPM
jgi:hypothetical protein